MAEGAAHKCPPEGIHRSVIGDPALLPASQALNLYKPGAVRDMAGALVRRQGRRDGPGQGAGELGSMAAVICASQWAGQQGQEAAGTPPRAGTCTPPTRPVPCAHLREGQVLPGSLSSYAPRGPCSARSPLSPLSAQVSTSTQEALLHPDCSNSCLTPHWCAAKSLPEAVHAHFTLHVSNSLFNPRHRTAPAKDAMASAVWHPHFSIPHSPSLFLFPPASLNPPSLHLLRPFLKCC